MVVPMHHWGRPLDAYVTSYTRDKTTSRLPDSDDPQQFAIGRQIIKKICLVAHDPAVSSKISVSDLLEVLDMSRSPAGYSLFLNSRLISGCIRLMSRLPLSQAGRQAPFSYEYGYLCFRLLILALGMSLIDGREGYYQSFMQDVTTYPDMEPICRFSLSIRVAVAEHITHSAEVGDGQGIYSCVLGWLRCSECPELPELVSRSDASKLLSMIWDDEKQFTKAMLQTYSPGLSGVVYLLWKYVQYEQHLKDHPYPDGFMVPFVDVFFRCILCSTPDQAIPLSMIRMANPRVLQLREMAPIKIRSELADSRLMIQAFIYQLNLGILRDDGKTSLRIEDLPDILQFLNFHFVPGCQDMIPELIGTTIQRCWVLFLNPSRIKYFPAAFTATFDWSRALIGQLRQLEPTPANQSIKLEVLTSAVDNDLIDFIGHIMVLIDPTPPKLIDSENNKKFLRECEEFFILLSSLHPGMELEDHFSARGMGWWKFYWYLRHIAELPSDDPRHAMFYNTCANTWASLRPSVNPNDLASTTEHHMCSYERCPNPEIPWGLGYVCDACKRKVYCGTACFQRDRELGVSEGSEEFNGSRGHTLR